MGEAIKDQNGAMDTAHSAVFKKSESLEGACIKIEGYDFNRGVDYPQLIKSLLSTGFQKLTELDWRLSDEPIMEDCKEEEKDPAYRDSVTTKIFLGFTSNLISSGVRDTIRYLLQHRMNKIPIFCPSLTDGSLGDMLYFHSFTKEVADNSDRNPGLIIDIVGDIRAMNGEAVHTGSRKTGALILGGGLPKHHICNANMMRNGADFAVYVITTQEFDGSDSGARPDEAVSWGKIRGGAKTVKVHCDATIAFPLLVAETFATKANIKSTDKALLFSYTL